MYTSGPLHKNKVKQQHKITTNIYKQFVVLDIESDVCCRIEENECKLCVFVAGWLSSNEY